MGVSGMLLIYGIIFGVLLGLAVTTLVTVWAVKTSNDIGDSRGGFMDFADYMNVSQDQDNLRSIY